MALVVIVRKAYGEAVQWTIRILRAKRKWRICARHWEPLEFRQHSFTLTLEDELS
jgi:hypothetical protein